MAVKRPINTVKTDFLSQKGEYSSLSTWSRLVLDDGKILSANGAGGLVPVGVRRVLFSVGSETADSSSW
jgi:hypothetical protein